MLSIIESMLQLYNRAVCCVLYTISTTGTGDEERECRGCLEPGAGTLPGYSGVMGQYDTGHQTSCLQPLPIQYTLEMSMYSLGDVVIMGPVMVRI